MRLGNHTLRVAPALEDPGCPRTYPIGALRADKLLASTRRHQQGTCYPCGGGGIRRMQLLPQSAT
jgi:hypothetical protein